MRYKAVGTRYGKLWDEYLSDLVKNPDLPLSRFLRLRHIGIHGFEMWMSRKGLSALQAKANAKRLQPESQKEGSTVAMESSLVPVVVHEDSHSGSNPCDVLTGISLTLPDGTVITIRRGSAGAVVSFLKLYSGEGSPCSD